jgi:hypothetical protein
MSGVVRARRSVTDRMTARDRGRAVGDAAAMSNPTRAGSTLPSHVDGRLQLGLGLVGVLVAAAVVVQLWAPVLFFPVALAVELWIGGMAAVFGLLAVRSGLVWARARRTARRFGPHAWAGVCLQPEHELRLRLLVVDPATGVQLLTPGGRPVAGWTFAELRAATVEPLYIHRKLHPGLHLRRGGEVIGRLAFPGRVAGFRYDATWFAAVAINDRVRAG